jgi:hypothetical protein
MTFIAYDSSSRITSIARGDWHAKFLCGLCGALASTERDGTLDHSTWEFGSLVEQRTRANGHVEVDRRVPARAV